ncbi:hypothetical protein GCM10009016_18690 [Halomonas beimenensis]
MSFAGYEYCHARGLPIGYRVVRRRGRRLPITDVSRDSSRRESITMKRKPDLVMTLVLIFGIGVVATGYAQALAGH